MCCKGFFKRVAPFFLTLAVGLFIASFFVTVAAPKFPFKRGGFNRHQQYHQRMESEIQRLKEENLRLKRENEKANEVEIKNLKYTEVVPLEVRPLDVEPVHPKSQVAPKKVK